MAQSAASKAEQAADAVYAFLRDRPAAALSADPGQVAVPPQAGDGARGDDVGLPPRREARQAGPAAVQAFAAGTPLRLPHTDWLFHRLMATGPIGTLAAFRMSAAGAGTIPWKLDLDILEEDWFHLLVNPAHRALSLAGARVLADQLREAVERRHAVAVVRVGCSRACPLDLHALVPMPAAILLLEVGQSRRRTDEMARRQAEWEEQARQRAERERLQAVEEARREALKACAESWWKAATLRGFVAEVRARMQVGQEDVPPDAAGWVVLASAHADSLDRLANGIVALVRDVDAASAGVVRPVYR